MSYPASRLAQFRSYSYHHVLAICNSTTAADELSRSNDEAVWTHAPDNSLPRGRYSPKTIGGADAGMKYCIVINGTYDATFTISRAQWAASTGAAATPNDNNGSVAMEGTLSISEPKGVVFLDQLVKCCIDLDISAQSAVYVLKTFFVGYGFDSEQGDYVDHISDIPPLIITITNATGKFTEQGGIYELNFVSNVGGLARLPQYSRIPGTINIEAAGTLGSTLQKLEARINEAYQPYYDCMKSQISAGFEASGKDPAKALAALQPVKYKITYDSVYENYTVTNQAQVGKTDPACNAPVMISSTANMSIEDLIRKVMLASKEVNQDMSVGDGGSPSIKREFKIHAGVEQLPTGPVVTYDVKPFMRPKELVKSQSFKNFVEFDSSNDPYLDPQLKQQIIMFDYIYTGKNVDILEFEMNINHGLAYMQTATVANSFKEQLDNNPSAIVLPQQYDQNHLASNGKITPVPVFFGSKVMSPITTNAQNLASQAQAAYTLTKHSSTEVAGDAIVKITGNTNLLAGIAQYSSPEFHKTFNETQQAPTSDRNRLTGFGLMPTFAKINIKMPRNNDDMSLFSGIASDDGSTDYAVDFWFDGYYYIVSIDNVFEQGVFTQELHMVGLPRAGVLDPLNDIKEGKVNEIDFTQVTGDCTKMNNVGCGQPTTGSNPSPQIAAPANRVYEGIPYGNPSPTNKEDADVAIRSVAAPSDVKGWDGASPAVKNSILNAAAKTGTNATTLAQMAAIESNFGKNTHNPKSSATGTFQIVRSTWNGTVNNGGVPDVPPGTDFSQASDPDNNATVAAVLMHQNQNSIKKVCGVQNAEDVSPGDTYMAHFLGAGGASAVIKADNDSGGNLTVRDAYYNKFGNYRAYNQAKASNPTIINDNTTVHELRAGAAVSMANTSPLSKSVKTAGNVQRTPVARAPTTPISPPTTTRTGSDAKAAATNCGDADSKTSEQKSCNEPNKVASESTPENRQSNATPEKRQSNAAVNR